MRDACVDINGDLHLHDAKGGLVPLRLIKAQHLLEDETVRKIMTYASGLSDQISRFKAHTLEDLSAFEALLAQEYDARKGGAKGNKTFMSFDGLQKVVVQVSDNITFGPELQIAKELVDVCLNEWAADARAEIRTLVTQAFATDKAGQINRAYVFMLLRLEITDPRWIRGMDAIRDAMRVVGSTTYVRCYRRAKQDGPWEAVVIDMARA